MFALLESAFAQSGKRSPFQLQYHISPTRISIEALKTLPYGARIPTLLSNRPLITSGYTKVAMFLDLQLRGFCSRTRLTIFAQVDEAIEADKEAFGGRSGVFWRHVPRLLSWKDLSILRNGTVLSTFSKGFIINVTKSGAIIVIVSLCMDWFG
ncbi:hypothetical protein DITRI_Ditri09bG0009300 [Diplodiscus trichospermus]